MLACDLPQCKQQDRGSTTAWETPHEWRHQILILFVQKPQSKYQTWLSNRKNKYQIGKAGKDIRWFRICFVLFCFFAYPRGKKKFQLEWRKKKNGKERNETCVCPGRSKVVASLVIIPYLGIRRHMLSTQFPSRALEEVSIVQETCHLNGLRTRE